MRGWRAIVSGLFLGAVSPVARRRAVQRAEKQRAERMELAIKEQLAARSAQVGAQLQAAAAERIRHRRRQEALEHDRAQAQAEEEQRIEAEAKQRGQSIGRDEQAVDKTTVSHRYR